MPGKESMGFINNLSSSYLQSVLNSVPPGSGLITNPTPNSPSGISTSPVGLKTDNQQLSPFAHLLNTLQQLQQSDPAKYQQVTQEISTNLQSAAQTAQADGNSTAANHLNQLAADFTNASQSGQLPNIQDLAQAMSGLHHHHHHHSHAGSTDPDGDSSSGSSSSGASSSSGSQALSQLLSTLQANGTQNGSLDPMAIIFNTLSDAGMSGSNG